MSAWLCWTRIKVFSLASLFCMFWWVKACYCVLFFLLEAILRHLAGSKKIKPTTIVGVKFYASCANKRAPRLINKKLKVSQRSKWHISPLTDLMFQLSTHPCAIHVLLHGCSQGSKEPRFHQFQFTQSYISFLINGWGAPTMDVSAFLVMVWNQMTWEDVSNLI